MIKIESIEVYGLKPAIRGMRNPMNSWDKSDSHLAFFGEEYWLGPNDHELALKLAHGGSVHAKYRRMIVVYMDMTAPLYWWKEMDTYKVGTVANSGSTMHKILAKEFTREDFSYEDICDFESERVVNITIETLNFYRNLYSKIDDEWQEFCRVIKEQLPYSELFTIS